MDDYKIEFSDALTNMMAAIEDATYRNFFRVSMDNQGEANTIIAYLDIFRKHGIHAKKSVEILNDLAAYGKQPQEDTNDEPK